MPQSNPRPWQPARARPPVECLWLLWQTILKNVVEPLPVQHKPEIFSVADDLVLYNRLIRLLEPFLLTVRHRTYSQYQARIHLERSQQAASLSFFNLKRLNWTFSRNPRQLLNEVLFVGLGFGKREQKAPESATKIICKDKLFYRANHTLEDGWCLNPDIRNPKEQTVTKEKQRWKKKKTFRANEATSCGPLLLAMLTCLRFGLRRPQLIPSPESRTQGSSWYICMVHLTLLN